MKRPQNNLNSWLEHLERKSPKENCTNTYLQSKYPLLNLNNSLSLIITVAGTNGKGSTVSLLEQIFIENGYSVGSNTSPHLIKYNERIKYNGEPVSDSEIVEAFNCIEDIYGDDNLLRYTHFAFLASVVFFAKSKPDVILLEVGLGGRLDPSNTLDADVAILTSVGLDHTQLLGDTREKIALEKVAISRPGKPLIVAEEDLPNSLMGYINQNNIHAKFINKDFFVSCNDGSIVYRSNNQKLEFRKNDLLHKNTISATLAALEQLPNHFKITPDKTKNVIQNFSVPGRRHILPNQKGKIILDVSHNLPAIEELFRYIDGLHIKGDLYVIYGSMSNKDIEGIFYFTDPKVDSWNLISLAEIEPRGASLSYLEKIFGQDDKVHYHRNAQETFNKLRSELKKDDCLLVFGSFVLIGDLLAQYGNEI